MKWSIHGGQSGVRELSLVPTKIVGFGRTYPKHAQELNNSVPEQPIFFLKPPSALVGNGEAIVRPACERVDYEGELAAVIGQISRHLSAAEAYKSVLGYTCANDVTARSLRTPGEPWLKSKGFDTFLPMSRELYSDLNPDEVMLRTFKNGLLVQEACTSEMTHSVGELLATLSSVMTLCPGDIILLGTPAGVGPLHHGDEIKVAIEGASSISNPVVDAAKTF